MIGVVVLLFGRHKVSDLMGDVAQGIKSFKKGIADDEPASVKADELSRRARPRHRWPAGLTADGDVRTERN